MLEQRLLESSKRSTSINNPDPPSPITPSSSSTPIPSPSLFGFPSPSLFDDRDRPLSLSMDELPKLVVQEEELKEVINGQYVAEGQQDETQKNWPRTAWKLWLKESGLAADGRGSRAMAWILSLTAGWLSAVGYVVLYSTYIGPMSGNTITVASTLSQKEWNIALSRLATLGVYCFGTAAGAFIREICTLYKIKRVTSIFFGVELLCVGAFFFTGQFWVPPDSRTHEHWGFYVVMTPAVLALSFQIVALQRVGTMPMSSTVITTTLARASGELVSYGFLRKKAIALHSKIATRKKNLENYAKRMENMAPLQIDVSPMAPTPPTTPAIKDLRPELKKQLKADKKLATEYNNKLREHLNASFFYWVMWFSYLIGALFGCLFQVVLNFELWSTVPVMGILFILIAADIYADF